MNKLIVELIQQGPGMYRVSKPEYDAICRCPEVVRIDEVVSAWGMVTADVQVKVPGEESPVTYQLEFWYPNPKGRNGIRGTGQDG